MRTYAAYGLLVGRRRERAAGEDGFTLVELLVAMAVMAILVAIAIPSYLSFTGRADRASANADVRAIVPSIEAYFVDNKSYAGMTLAGLRAGYDSALPTSVYSLSESGSSYCVSATVAGMTFRKNGPYGAIAPGTAC